MRRRPPNRLGTGTTIAQVRDLRVTLGGALILDGVTLPVRTGEVLALVGPNGAGKSTLLNALCGDVPWQGEVCLYGEPLDHWSQVEMAMRRAVMLQQAMISFPFTVGHIVAMGRAPWIGTEAEEQADEAVRTALTLADVVSFVDRVFSSLSGGERARVSLARALAQRTQLLLLDEPTAALDLHHQEDVLQLARSRAAEGDAVVVVLHDLNLAAGYADQVAVLSRGALAAYGPPRVVLTAPLLSKVYQHDVEVWPHPATGEPVILPKRG
ncbi:iron complex transport system ATP-binding protein [Kribbella sp. VKM Ac-2527]|uniref:Iron complex transport system ATP-binding protein n=1 Tax=Kribbella caucasensis TaxID=2512215 RepID=A0A4R6KJ06_9ACTN|nr:heme ABC transporter ATP-binding protein [Kribbella sp. VKM Ac-2527]TDO51284.1 iron complex transport system ATP-binding protein [Kribbella sp. VKM Ac-2527]